MSVESPEHAGPPARPRAVTLVAWLHIVQGVVLVITGLVAFVLSGRLPGPDGTTISVTESEMVELTILAILATGLGIFGLVIAVGLLRLSPWAWLVAMTLQGVSLAIGLIARSVGNPDELTLLIGVIVVMVLNQQEVRGAFERSGRRRV